MTGGATGSDPPRWVRLAAMVASCVLAVVGPLAVSCAPSYPDATHPDQPVPDDPPRFIFPEEAALFVGHEGVSFVDSRPLKLYRKGHVPGAVQLDWSSLRDPGAGTLSGRVDSDLDHVAGLLAAGGLSHEDWVIVVGDAQHGWGEEGRIAWTLRLLGHEKVSVLDGGYRAWIGAGLDKQRGALEREPALYESLPTYEVLARKADVQRFSDNRWDWRYVLVDTRERDEFRGASLSPTHGATRRGHVPGAISLPWHKLLDEGGRLRPPEELEAILIPLGIRPDAHVIVYCTGGVRSAHTWWVLDSLGYPSVRNYAGSWWEWALDRKLPLERGGQRPPVAAPEWPPP